MRWLASSVLLILGGCGPQVDHPSLAPRAIEKAALPLAPAADPSVDTPVDQAVKNKVAALVAQAVDGAAQFDSAADAANAAVARGGAVSAGSEAWVDAEQAVTRLDALRAPIIDSLADLDRLSIEQGNARVLLLEAALSQVSALDTRTRAAVAALKDRLSRP